MSEPTTLDDALAAELPRWRLEEELEKIAAQINELADLIMHEIPGEPSAPEGTVECAIRLLRQAYVAEIPSFPARTTDPGTSDDSATRKRSRDVGRFTEASTCAALLRVIAESPRTAYGAAVMLGYNSVSRLEGARRRVSDLVRAHYVVDSGKRRRNPGSPDESIVWEISPRGRMALRQLDETGWSK